MGNESNKTQKKKIKNNTKKIIQKKNDVDNSDDENDYSFLIGIHCPSLMDYKYSDRRVQYYSEKMEKSKEEEKLISEIKSDKVDLYEFPPNNGETIKVIIDTDIGTDWDDAMALSYAFKIPNLEILGITTNYGIPDLRANVAQKIVDAYLKANPEKKSIPIIPGSSRPLGSHRELIVFGHEGRPFFKKKELKKVLKMDYIMNREQEKASDFIASTVKKYPGKIKIISIGIPTNIGLTLTKHKDIIPLIKEIVIMGCGDFLYKKDNNETLNEIKNGNKVDLFPNHNISGDTLATKILFDSGVKVKIVNHLVSTKFWANGEVINYFREKAKNAKDLNNLNDPDVVIGLLMIEWFKIRRRNGQIPHDPLAIHEAVFGGDQSPLLYLRGKIFVHEWAAFSTFTPQKDGPHYLSVKIKDNNNFLDVLTKTIMNSNNI